MALKSDCVSGHMPVSFKKWTPPNFAQLAIPRSDDEGKSIHISSLSNDLLDGLAAAWLDDLYSKAGKSNPFVMQDGLVR